MKACVLLALASCVSVVDEGGPWEPVESITGDLAPELGPAMPVAPTPPKLRIASFNVHFGENIETISANILASSLADVDLWMVQEIEVHAGEAGTRSQRFAEALGMTWVYAPARLTDHGTHGIGLVSRFPLEDVQIRKLPFIDQPFRARTRNAVRAVLVAGERRVQIVNVHLDVRLGAADRIYQLDPAVVDLDDSLPVIVGGDFNTNPWAWTSGAVPLTGTEAIVGMEQAVIVDNYMTGLGFAGSISEDAATVRIPGITVRADNLYTRGIAFDAAGLAFVDGSDHWPVFIDVPLAGTQ